MKESIAFRQQLAALSDQASDLVKRSKDEKREWTSDEDAKYTRIAEDIAKLTVRLKSAEQIEAAQESLRIAGEQNEDREDRQRVEQPEKLATEKRYEAAFMKNICLGREAMTQEERTILASRERRDLAGNAGAGAVMLPEGMFNSITMAAKDFSGLLKVCEYVVATTGRDAVYPLANDTANIGEQLGTQNAAATSQDMSTGEVVLKAWPFSSKLMKFSNQFLRDEGAQVQSKINMMAAERLGRLWEAHCADSTRDGSTSIQGLTNAAPLGITTAAAAAVTSDEFLRLIHSIDPVYRNNNFRLLFNDTTLLAASTLKDSQGRPLFQMNFSEAMPATIHGRRFEIWQALPNMGAANRFCVAGDMKNYVFRIAGGMSLRRSDERFFELNQTAFIIFADADGKLVDAGGNPIKYMRNA